MIAQLACKRGKVRAFWGRLFKLVIWKPFIQRLPKPAQFLVALMPDHLGVTEPTTPLREPPDLPARVRSRIRWNVLGSALGLPTTPLREPAERTSLQNRYSVARL